MQTAGTDQLVSMAEKREYAPAASLLEAVSQLAVHFRAFQSVPKVAELTKRVGEVREDLTQQIFVAFNDIGALASDTANPEDFARESEVGRLKKEEAKLSQRLRREEEVGSMRAASLTGWTTYAATSLTLRWSHT